MIRSFARLTRSCETSLDVSSEVDLRGRDACFTPRLRYRSRRSALPTISLNATNPWAPSSQSLLHVAPAVQDTVNDDGLRFDVKGDGNSPLESGGAQTGPQ